MVTPGAEELLTTAGPQQQQQSQFQQGHRNRVDANKVETPAISGMSTTEGKPKYCGNNRKRRDVNNRIKQQNAMQQHEC
jgi:hypothetical protein